MSEFGLKNQHSFEKTCLNSASAACSVAPKSIQTIFEFSFFFFSFPLCHITSAIFRVCLGDRGVKRDITPLNENAKQKMTTEEFCLLVWRKFSNQISFCLFLFLFPFFVVFVSGFLSLSVLLSCFLSPSFRLIFCLFLFVLFSVFLLSFSLYVFLVSEARYER